MPSPSITDLQFNELVRNIYEAAAEPHLWSDFLRKYAAYTKSDAVSLVVHDFTNQHADLVVSVGIDPYWQQRYEAYYASINEWTLRKPHLFKPGAILHGEQAVSSDDLRRTEYFSDFLRPNDWLHSYGGVMDCDASTASYLSSLRSESRGAFTDDANAEILPRLLPHLQCSLRLHQRIAGLQASLEAATDALDHIPVGVIVADAQRRPLFINRAARAVLDAADGISLRSSQLEIAHNDGERWLRERLTIATGSRNLASGAMFRLARPSGKRPFELILSPLPASSSLGKGRPAAVIFVTDPESATEPDIGILRHLYGLTASEARLASALIGGQTLNEFAEQAEVSMNTARTHLKRIFSKTGTTRQGELIRLLLSSSAMLRK